MTERTIRFAESAVQQEIQRLPEQMCGMWP
jgi:hypothetical protein